MLNTKIIILICVKFLNILLKSKITAYLSYYYMNSQYNLQTYLNSLLDFTLTCV